VNRDLLARYRKEPSSLDELFYPKSQLLWEKYEELEKACTDEFNELTDYSASTADYPELAKKTGHYLFVYDGMKMGFKRHKQLMLKDCCAVGYTKVRFQMFRRSVNSLIETPVVLLSHTPEKRAPVYGEIYCVSPETIAELDWHESNGILANRRRIAIDAVIDEKGTQKQIWAFMYIHSMDYYQSRMDQLRPADLLTANADKMKYYNFMKKYETKFN